MSDATPRVTPTVEMPVMIEMSDTSRRLAR
jgi:hypothetical protein